MKKLLFVMLFLLLLMPEPVQASDYGLEHLLQEFATEASAWGLIQVHETVSCNGGGDYHWRDTTYVQIDYIFPGIYDGEAKLMVMTKNPPYALDGFVGPYTPSGLNGLDPAVLIETLERWSTVNPNYMLRYGVWRQYPCLLLDDHLLNMFPQLAASWLWDVFLATTDNNDILRRLREYGYDSDGLPDGEWARPYWEEHRIIKETRWEIKRLREMDALQRLLTDEVASKREVMTRNAYAFPVIAASEPLFSINELEAAGLTADFKVTPSAPPTEASDYLLWFVFAAVGMLTLLAARRVTA